MQQRSTVKWDCSNSEELHDFKIQEEEGVKGKEGGGGASHIAWPNSSFLVSLDGRLFQVMCWAPCCSLACI